MASGIETFYTIATVRLRSAENEQQKNVAITDFVQRTRASIFGNRQKPANEVMLELMELGNRVEKLCQEHNIDQSRARCLLALSETSESGAHRIIEENRRSLKHSAPVLKSSPRMTFRDLMAGRGRKTAG
ncbi:hypothetical protein JXD20_02730 [Candidatus Peregrinibacteria bacterium]|nr:hypothetical protein [Candidatus Peregrinibacteria bacterium]